MKNTSISFFIWLTCALSLTACDMMTTTSTERVSSQKSQNNNTDPTINTPVGAVTFNDFQKVIQSRCIVCHDNTVNGDFRLSQDAWTISSYISPGDADDSKIYNYLMGSDAPIGPKNMPKGLSAIPQGEIQIVKSYINGLRSTSVSCTAPEGLRSPANFLNTFEFSNSINDLLGTTGWHSDIFPYRERDLYGFGNKPIDFKEDPVFVEALYDKIDGLLETVGQNTQNYPALFSCGSTNYTNEACRKTLVSNFAQRAFRRPLRTGEADTIYAAMNDEATALGKMKAAYLRVLLAPEFMFRMEDETGSSDYLSDFEIATRLSYLLWNTTPDSTLLNLASQGQLKNKTVLEQQVQRLITDPKAARFAEVFGSEWLTLERLDLVDTTSNFSEALRSDFKKETVAFLKEVLLKRPMHELVTAKYSFLNNQLASHYQVSGPSSATLQKTDLPNSSYRRGLLSQGSILAMTFQGLSDTKPVLRGNYVLTKILCDRPLGEIPDTPPIDISQLPANHTFKDILAHHRKNPTCAGCHQHMDPIGLSFDHFDGIGKFRTKYGAAYNYLNVDTSEKLYTQSFSSSYDMMDLIASNDKFYQCVTEHAYAYAFRAPISVADKCTVKDLATQVRSGSLGFKDLVIKIVTNDAYLKRD